MCAVVLYGKELQLSGVGGFMTSVPVSVEHLGERGSSGLDLTLPRGSVWNTAKRRALPCLPAGLAKGQKSSFPQASLQAVPPPSAPP